MADISQIKLPSNVTYDIKDTVARNDIGVIDYPYQEVEWVESNGKQFVYLDWKPPIATWGFEADFLVRNAFNTTDSAWNASTNANGWGCIFGVYNATNVNDISLSTYSANGTFHAGAGATAAVGFKTDKTRQTMSYIGTTFTKPNGSTMTIARVNETANKPYCNMTIFAKHNGLRRSGSGNLQYPSSTRIYSLKFYDGTELKVNLVGAIRKADGITGLYDKIAKHFFPAPDMTYGEVVGDLGDKETILESIEKEIIEIVVSNASDTRMWRVNAPQLTQLEDGQKFNISTLYAVTSSTQTTELAGWDDTTSNSNVYIKVTLADNKTTEWIPAYALSTTRLTTHFATGAPLLFTYRENVFSGASATAAGSTIMRAFYVQPYYNTNTTTANHLYHYNNVKARQEFAAESLIVGDATGFEKVGSGVTFDITYPILWSTAKVTQGSSNYANMFFCHYDRNIATGIKAGYTSAANKLQYLITTIDGNIATIDSTIITDTLPTTDDGKVYIELGKLGAQSTGANYFILYPSHHFWWYKNGKIRQYGDYGHSIGIDVPSNAVFTDTDTKVNMIARGTTKSYLLGTTTAPTSSNQAVSSVAETGVYFDTTAATLVATTFKGALTGTASGNLTSSSTLNAAKLSGAIPSDVTATTQTAGNNSTKIATTAYVDGAINGLPTPMQFIGTVGTNGTTTWANLPTASGHTGYTYKVITDHAAETGKPAAEAGDTIISNGTNWIVIPSGDETATQSATTGISIAAHSTTSIYGVQSSTTSVRGVKTGDNSTTTASKVTLGTAISIPNVTGNTDVTVPIAASSATTVPIKNSSATTVPIKNTSATSIPNVTAVGSGSASLTFAMDGTDTSQLNITFSHTHTPPTLGTAISIIGVQSSTTSVIGVQSSTTSVTGVNGSTTASKVTLGTAKSVPNVTAATDVTVPIRADSDTTVPIKNSSSTTVATSGSHSVTDNGHTHTI